MFKFLRSIFRAQLSRNRFEESMSDELRFHLEERTEDLVRSGVPLHEARRQARIELGGLNSVKEECRQSRGLHIVDAFLREMRHAARLFRKEPWFALTALLTLSVCIGANLTIFAVIDSILLRPLPFPEAHRLVTMFNTYPRAGVDRDGSSITNYYERRGKLAAFNSLSIYRYGTALIGAPGSAEREDVTFVSPEFFATLQSGPVLGRTFREEETTYKTDSVAILSDAYWRQHFQANPQAVGSQIQVDGTARTIIGVLPPAFRFLSSEARLYFPLASDLSQRMPLQRHSGGNQIQMIARLNPGFTVAQAQAELDAQNARLERDDPQAKMMAEAGFRSPVVPLHADHVASIRPTLLLLQAGVLGLLLIGAVNLLNLLLVRANARTKESAVRRALGASSSHLLAEVVGETGLLSIVGGLLGLAFAAGGIHLLTTLGAGRLPLGTQIVFNGRLAIVALVGSVALGIVLALPSAWFQARGSLLAAMQAESRTGTASHAAQRLRHSFIIAQIALAFVLLTGSALLGISLQNARHVSPGFQATHVLSGRLSLPGKDYPNEQKALAFTEQMTQGMESQPGVQAVGVANNVPFSGFNGKSSATVKGYVRKPGESLRGSYSYGVGGDYFAAMGFTLRAGRFLNASDSRRAQRVCVVDEDFAQYYWPHHDAVGQRLFQGGNEAPDAEAFTVVGVVGRVRQAGLTAEENIGAVYYPFVYRADNSMFVVVRSSLSAGSMVPLLRRIVRQVDSHLPVDDIRSMDARIADSLAARRSPALLAAFFSAIALFLTAIGTYGVLSFAVAQRRREIGVRMALGAQPLQIGSQFLLLALRLLTCGMALGIAGAYLAGRAMQSVLFHVPSFHLPTLAATLLVMGIVSLTACLLPSYRAARISPMETLSDQ